MSGHSKWSQIKHRKGAADAKRGQLFGKLAKEITIAARGGSTDITANARLRATVERARAEGLPKDNIERAIARASGTDAGELFEILCEATAPGGVAVIIEAITDSKNRTINEIKHLLTGQGSKLAEPGSLLWNFEKIGVIEIAAADNPGKTKEQIESAIIESGADDFQESGGMWMLETAFADVEKVRHLVESVGISIKETGHDYKPRTTILLPEHSRDSLEKLLEALSGQDDVQEVYTNAGS